MMYNVFYIYLYPVGCELEVRVAMTRIHENALFKNKKLNLMYLP